MSGLNIQHACLVFVLASLTWYAQAADTKQQQAIAKVTAVHEVDQKVLAQFKEIVGDIRLAAEPKPTAMHPPPASALLAAGRP